VRLASLPYGLAPLNLNRELDATTPDEKLYPEFDDQLRQAMLAETRLFLRELIEKSTGMTLFVRPKGTKV